MDEGKFDFHQATDEEESLDYNKLKPCPKCKKPIAQDAVICYFCGQDVIRPGKTPWAGWVAAGLIIIFILSILLGLIG